MNSEARRGGNSGHDGPPEAGSRIAQVEDGAIRPATTGIYRFRQRHPWIFGLIAYIIGSGLIAIVTARSYGDWSFEGVNLKAAFYQLVGGAFVGGIVMVILAFAWTRTLRPVVVSPVNIRDAERDPSAKP